MTRPSDAELAKLLREDHGDECSMYWLSDYSGAQTCDAEKCGLDNRREAAAAALEAAASEPSEPFEVKETPPVLHGDGVHDDTEAVNWYAARGLPLALGGTYIADPARLRLPPGTGLVALGDGYQVGPAICWWCGYALALAPNAHGFHEACRDRAQESIR